MAHDDQAALPQVREGSTLDGDSLARRYTTGRKRPNCYAASAAPRRLDCSDVDLSHFHHCFIRKSCLTPASRHCFHQYTRRDLPGHCPLVLAPAARTLLATVADDGIPVAIRLSLILGSDLKRKGSSMFERRPSVELMHETPAIVTGCTVDGSNGTVRKGLGLKASGALGILIVAEIGHKRKCRTIR